MCQVLNDHWGYAKEDCNYKSVKELIENLVDCRRFNCNFLLNTGLCGNGMVNSIDKYILKELGKWIKANKGFIYNAKASDIEAQNAYILKDDKYYYAIIKDVPMAANPNVAKGGKTNSVLINKKITIAVWLDNE